MWSSVHPQVRIYTDIISKAVGEFHSDWKLASDKSEHPDARLKLTKAKEVPTCLLIEVWFDFGGSRSSARVLRV